MKFSASLFPGLLLLLASLLLSGCWPQGQTQFDEEKEPHFLAGKGRVNAMDYKGAVESFEKALEVNPKSASAHLELGVLFDQKEGDPAAAIYHYSRYLKLQPSAGNAEMVNTRILACKQELARTVSLGPVTQTLQTEFEKLTEEKNRLSDDNKRLRELVDQWRAYAASRLQAPTNVPAVPLRAAQPVNPAPTAGPPAFAMAPGSGRPGSTGSTTVRTHTVKSGETPVSIARRYGVKVEALLAANPRIEPRRLRPGQTLVVPQ
jgi:nucleoid-associated protein YgaU